MKVSLHRNAPAQPELDYLRSISQFGGSADKTTAVWEPEMSLGPVENKGLVLLGYYGEVNEFARAILEDRPVIKCGLDHAWQVTRIFEGFVEGPGKRIVL